MSIFSRPVLALARASVLAHMALPLLLGPAAIVLTTVPVAAQCDLDCDNIPDPSGGGGTSSEEETSGGGGTPGGGTPGGTEPPGGGGTPGGGETPGGGGESTPPSKPDEQSQTSSTAEPFVPVFATTVTPRIEEEDVGEDDDYSYEEVSTTEIDENGRTVTVVKLVKLKVAIKPAKELTSRQKSMAMALKRAGGPSIYLTDPTKARQLERLLRNSKEVSLAGSLARSVLTGDLSDYLDERYEGLSPEAMIDELNEALLTLKTMLKAGVSPQTFRNVRKSLVAYLEAKGHTIVNADEGEDEESEA